MSKILMGAALLALGLQGCATQSTPAAHSHEAAEAKGHGHPMDMDKMAVASLSPATAGGVNGLVMFHQMGDDLMVHVRASGFAPNSTHGFHVHAVGSCASADFTSAGGHFNPANKPHGAPDADHHAGDIPNLVADAQGAVSQKFHLKGGALKGPNGVIGHAVIVHADADDYKTQPTGNSGARIACGVIAGH